MLKELRISNFRCYVDTTIHFNGTAILVGKNNAGKSTSIEALKIISTVVRKYKSARYMFPPEWVNERFYGISPNVENMNISDRGIFHMYGEPPAIIEALFSNGTSIKAYVGEGLDIFAIIFGEDGTPVQTAKQAKKVIGIEYVPEAIEDAKVNSQLNNIDNTLFYAGDMKDILNREFIERHGRPDVIITDPPRAGMHDDVINTILFADPARIVYVSCNPATQARDLQLLDVKYRVTHVQPVDMFPHTQHVENVVLLEHR